MKLLMFTLCFFYVTGVQAQKLALRFEVLAGEFSRKDCPVSIDLLTTNLELQNSIFQLYELTGKSEIIVPCQIEAGKNPRLYFVLAGELKRGGSRNYELRINEGAIPVDLRIGIKKEKTGLKLVFEGKPILNYQFKEVFPPEGVDPLFKRSGFIHPLWSPGGEILTRIQAPDHYHHYGIWGPWTKTHIDGREVDFWNLYKGEGTVRFSNFISEVEGPVCSGFSVLQEHIDFGAKGEDQVAINETLEVVAWNIVSADKVWIIDYISTMNCPLDQGILLDAYRYGGGIGFRGTEKWTRHNSTVMTSEGNDRGLADGSRARWCKVEGESMTGRSGILFMSHSSNREFPEPMRVWPLDANNGRGDMYFEFCPIRDNEWMLEKGKNYSQKYRLVVFDGVLTDKEAEQHWTAFAEPPVVQIEINNNK